MTCPVCNNQQHVEIDMHADGYADNLLECSVCGTLWQNEFGEIILINRKAA